MPRAWRARENDRPRAEVASDVPARAVLVGAATLPADCVVVGHHDAAAIGQTELGSMALHVRAAPVVVLDPADQMLADLRSTIRSLKQVGGGRRKACPAGNVTASVRFCRLAKLEIGSGTRCLRYVILYPH